MTAQHFGAEYRRDIDGIRAVAVAVVLLFHLGLSFMQGGFAGVDVFFVISGYLITGIIVRALEKGSFTISGFYVRRINRIIPALLIILVAVWSAGWLFMFAREFNFLGRDVFGGSTFISNFYFAGGLGYWNSPHQPLLHLWSLAVEEQFYFVWPITMLIVWKTKRDVRWTIIAIIEISFVINVYQSRHSAAQAAFYLPLARFWEILSGALLFQIENSTDGLGRRYRELSPRARDVMSVAGSLLIALTVATVHPGDLWPGLKGLMPVTGTLLLIAAGPDALVNRTILSHRWMVGLGLISYPLYLWHWPIIVFGWMIFEKVLPVWYSLAVIPVSIALAWATYQFVEKRIRFGKRKRRSAVLLLPGLAATAVLGLIARNGIVGTRLEDSVVNVSRKWGPELEFPRHNPNVMSPGEPSIYVFKGDDTRTIVFYGDSHMAHYWPRVDQVYRDLGAKRPTVAMMPYPGCSVFPDVNNPGRDSDGRPWVCDQFNRDVFKFASRPEVKTIVIASYWEAFMSDRPRPGHRRSIVLGDPHSEQILSEFEAQLSQLVKSGKTVYLVLSNPVAQLDVLGKTPRRLAGFGTPKYPPYATTQYHLAISKWTSQRLRQIAAKTGARTIDPTPYLCGPEVCPSVTPQGEPMYRDENHLRAGYVRRHATWLDPVFTTR